MKKNLRSRFMNAMWGGWYPPIWLQNAIGRMWCLAYGHEKTRSIYCDWCGKEIRK